MSFLYHTLSHNYNERATLARTSRVVIHSIFVLGPSALGKSESYLWQLKFKELTLQQKYLSRDIGTNDIRICSSNYPTVEIVSGTILKFVYFLIVNNNKYLPYVVDNIIFGISVPVYPSRTVESNTLRLYWNFSIFCLLYIHINNNKFTYDKFKTAKFGFSIFGILWLSFFNIVYFLDRHRRWRDFQ